MLTTHFFHICATPSPRFVVRHHHPPTTHFSIHSFATHKPPASTRFRPPSASVRRSFDHQPSKQKTTTISRSLLFAPQITNRANQIKHVIQPGSIRHTGQSVVRHPNARQHHANRRRWPERRPNTRLPEQIQFGDPYDGWRPNAGTKHYPYSTLHSISLSHSLTLYLSYLYICFKFILMSSLRPDQTRTDDRRPAQPKSGQHRRRQFVGGGLAEAATRPADQAAVVP